MYDFFESTYWRWLALCGTIQIGLYPNKFTRKTQPKTQGYIKWVVFGISRSNKDQTHLMSLRMWLASLFILTEHVAEIWRYFVSNQRPCTKCNFLGMRLHYFTAHTRKLGRVTLTCNGHHSMLRSLHGKSNVTLYKLWFPGVCYLSKTRNSRVLRVPLAQ